MRGAPGSLTGGLAVQAPALGAETARPLATAPAPPAATPGRRPDRGDARSGPGRPELLDRAEAARLRAPLEGR
jgi:hypothetical protein